MLVNRKHRISFQHSTRQRIIVPPPLSEWPLSLAQATPTLESHLHRALLVIGLGKPGHRVDGINLIGKVADSASKHAFHTAIPSLMPEKALFPAVLLEYRKCPEGHISQSRQPFRTGQR